MLKINDHRLTKYFKIFFYLSILALYIFENHRHLYISYTKLRLNRSTSSNKGIYVILLKMNEIIYLFNVIP